MKQGSTLVELAREVERQQQAKRDFVSSTRNLSFAPSDQRGFTLRVGQDEVFGVSEHAHRQIGERLSIPARYYDRMRADNPQLLQQNVNSWFQKEPERRMIRTLDTSARAFLSERFRRLDNFDLFNAALPALSEQPDMKLESCAITESRMYLKAVFPQITGEVRKGDVVQFGVIISNSEIGMGALEIAPLILRLICTNGMVAPDHRVRKNHVGRAAGGGDEAYELYSDEALAADDRAFFLKARDLIKATTTEIGTRRILARLQEAAGDPVTGRPEEVVEELGKRHSLGESESTSVLRYLIDGGDLSRWGLANAITATARDVENYDRATELERLGGQIIELPRSEWQPIAEAA
jgi:hypothetical protein